MTHKTARVIHDLETRIARLERLGSESLQEPKVGDILVNSWGYNVTMVDFYKVVAVSKTKRSVSLRKLKNDVVEGEPGFVGKTIPSNEFDPNEPLIRNKRVKWTGGTKYEVSVGRYRGMSAYLWDGRARYFNLID